MALRDQPYIPLYVQDFMTDERLMECSAEATGVYIRLICSLHKSDPYGKILLKQKYKQTDNQILNFATQLAKHFPFGFAVIVAGFEELIHEGVIQIEGNFLLQKRMVKDGELSEKRAKSGKIGGKKTQFNSHNFAKAKNEANTENEIVYENESEIKNENIVSYKEPTENSFKIGLCKAVLNDFGLNSIAHTGKLRIISDMLTEVEQNQGLQYFQEQYTTYKIYKKLSGEPLYGFPGFIKGGWDAENWQFKIDNFKSNGKQTTEARRESVADIRRAANEILNRDKSENN